MTLPDLLRLACTLLDADHHEVTTGNRKQPHLQHRQIITIALWQDGHTFTDIAKALNQHHTTTMHTVYTHWNNPTLTAAAKHLSWQLDQ